MGQPLTLDEVGVTEVDAAQTIYDLRRELNIVKSKLGSVLSGNGGDPTHHRKARRADRLDELLRKTTGERNQVKDALGALIDSLHDELQHEVNESPPVLEQARAACRLLGEPFTYDQEGWW